MLREKMQKHVPELTSILSTNCRDFVQGGSTAANYQQALLYGQRHLMPPLFCLCSAKLKGGINETTIQLGSLLHLTSIALYLQCAVPETVPAEDFFKEVQLPVLSGDLLFSCIYLNMSRYRLERYIPVISTIMCTVHESFTQEGYNSDQTEKLLKRIACLMGEHSVIGGADIYQKVFEACMMYKMEIRRASGKKIRIAEQLC